MIIKTLNLSSLEWTALKCQKYGWLLPACLQSRCFIGCVSLLLSHLLGQCAHLSTGRAVFGYMGRARRLEMLARGDCKWSVPSAHISQEIRWASWPLDKWVLDGWILAPQLVMPRFQCRSSRVGTLWGSPLLISSRDKAFYTSGWTQDFWLPINLVGTCQRFVY